MSHQVTQSEPKQAYQPLDLSPFYIFKKYPILLVMGSLIAGSLVLSLVYESLK